MVVDFCPYRSGTNWPFSSVSQTQVGKLTTCLAATGFTAMNVSGIGRLSTIEAITCSGVGRATGGAC